MALVYLGPSLLSETSSHFPVVLGNDGAYYAWRLQAALKGDPFLSCVQDPSLSTPYSFYPRQCERVWASLLRPVVGTDILSAIKVTYGVLPALWYLLLALTLRVLTQRPLLSVSIAVWAVLEGATVYWKPFLPQWPEEALPYFRYANPMLFGIPVVSAVACWFMVLRNAEAPRREWIKWVAATAICLGSVFYTQIYYWSWMGGVMALFAVWSWLQGDHRRAMLTGVIGAMGLILGAPQLVESLALRSHPLVVDVLHRGGLMIEGRTPYFIFHKAFWLTFLIYQAVSWRRWDWRWRVLTCAMLVGWGLLNENVVTGLSIQQHHYLRPLTLVYVLVIGDGLRRLAEILEARSMKISKRALAALFVLIVSVKGVLAVRYLAHESPATTALGRRAEQCQRTLRILRQLPAHERGGLLVDPSLAYVIGLMGDVPIYVHEYTNHCLVSDAELFARWGLLWRAFGRTSDQYAQVMRGSLSESGQPWWLCGLPEFYLGRRGRNLLGDRRAMAEACIQAFASRSLESFAKELQQGHGLPRLALSSPGFSLDLAEVQKVFALQRLAYVSEEGTELWQLNSKR